MKTTFSPKSGFSILKFLLGTILLLLVAIAVFLTFFLSPTAHWVANSQLGKILGTEASVEKVSIKLWSGDVEIGGVRIADPTSTPDNPKPDLFSLGRFFVDVDTSSLFSDTLVIHEVTVESPEFNGTRDENGKFSFEKLKVMQPPAEGEQPKEESAPKTDSQPSKGIRVESISITNLAGSFTDDMDAQAGKSYTLKHLNFRSGPISVNPGGVVDSLPVGTHLASLELSDAELDYQTSRNLPDPNAPAAKTKDGAETAAPAPEATTAETVPTSGSSPSPAEGSKTSEIDPVYLEKFSLTNFRIHYLDKPADEKERPMEVTLTDIYADAADVGFDPAGLLQNSVDKVLTAKMGFNILQKAEGASPAAFSAVAKSTVMGSGLPINAGSVQLTGFELATIGALVPKGVESAIGGPGFDLFAKWFVAPDQLEGTAKLTSSNNVVTKISVGGTPDKPTIKGGDILMNVVGRPGQFLGNLTGNAFQGGMEVVSGATEAAGELVKGAGETVAGFGKGLLNTGKGLLSGNLKEAGKGLSEATVGTVKNATSAVGNTAESAAGGVGKAYDATTGGVRTKDWRLSNTKRHEEFEKGAQAWLEDDTFPPPSSQSKPTETDSSGNSAAPSDAATGEKSEAQSAAPASESQTGE